MFGQQLTAAEDEGTPGPSAGTYTEPSACFRVMDLPELFICIARYLDPETIRTLRLVSRLFLDLCDPYFSITLDIDNLKRTSDVGVMFALLRDVMDDQGQKKWKRNPFDQIKALKVASGRHLYHHLSMAVPGGDMAAFLDHHRRWINKDDTLQQSQAATTLTGPGGWSPIYGHPLWLGLGEYGPPWTFWDLISSKEGAPLLRHLESLEVVDDRRDQSQRQGCFTPFFVRLSQSSATTTLHSLSLGPCPGSISRMNLPGPSVFETLLRPLNPSQKAWDINLRVFCDCICSLKALESLKIDSIDSFDMEDFYIDANTTTTSASNSQGKKERNSQRQLARNVKSLVFISAAPIQVKVPILALFPNLESLQLDRLDGLSDYQMDGYLSRMEHQGGHAGTAAVANRAILEYPRLKSLHVPLFRFTDWIESRLLQTWLRTAKRLDHFTVIIPSSTDMSRLIDVLGQEAITVKRIRIRSAAEDNATSISKTLILPMFRTLTDLQIQTVSLSAFGGFPTLTEQDRRWKFREHGIMTRLFLAAPWTRNLTSLSIPALFDPIVLVRDEKELWGLDQVSSQTLLKRMPNLVALELTDPIMDLTLSMD